MSTGTKSGVPNKTRCGPAQGQVDTAGLFQLNMLTPLKIPCPGEKERGGRGRGRIVKERERCVMNST